MHSYKKDLKLGAEKNRKRKSPAIAGDEVDEGTDFDKMKVECICPKCGQKHIMNFHWIGRGTPRKYCPLCKGSV